MRQLCGQGVRPPEQPCPRRKGESLVIIADPKMLGELRSHYHAKLSAVLLKLSLRI